MRCASRLLVAVFVVVATGCAGIGEAVGGVCLALAIQTAGQVCCDAAVGAVCDGVCGDADEGDGADGADAVPPPDPARDEIPPPPIAAPRCGIRQQPGGVWRLDCVDGTSAEALQADANGGVTPAEPETIDGTRAGDVALSSLGDVARLGGARAVMGSLTIGGSVLLRVSLPSLKSVEGDLIVKDTTHLVSASLPALRFVGGRLGIVGNRALSIDPVPALTSASEVDIAFNDALPTSITDRLLSIRPRRPAE